jgi:hypothetical protein
MYGELDRAENKAVVAYLNHLFGQTEENHAISQSE